ncbi:putative phloem protein [Dioscorea sansibarensis]
MPFFNRRVLNSFLLFHEPKTCIHLSLSLSLYIYIYISNHSPCNTFIALNSIMSGSHFKPLDGHIRKQPGDKSFEIDPQGLSIIWGNDNRYWKINGYGTDPAELVQVCWLEVTGTIPVGEGFLEKGKEYKLIFNLELKPDAFGWKESPVYFMVKPAQQRGRRWKKCDLGSGQPHSRMFEAPGDGIIFKVPNDAVTISFGMYETWKGTWKGGLKIHSVRFVPVNQS